MGSKVHNQFFQDLNILFYGYQIYLFSCHSINISVKFFTVFIKIFILWSEVPDVLLFAPTLLAYGGTYANVIDVPIETILPFEFLLVWEDQRWIEELKYSYNFAFSYTCDYHYNNSWKAHK